ncbi:MAG TPA: T9SS type A sorting domain-containing protein [Mariniphaga sp.]|nr:T9SS type A sorting domain-containing protein [Mariniphaga sp.]
MKWILLLFLLVVFIGNAAGQDNPKGADLFSDNPANLKLNKENDLYISNPRKSVNLTSSKKISPTFRVTYRNFPEEAKIAFNYAVSIWEELIYSPVPIHIEARWEELDGNILAKGNPSIFYNNFLGTPIRNVYYPVALAEKIAGKDLNAGAPDIICKFSSKYDWYYGTDGNPPPTHYDMVSSALHEITHGLGFSGFLNERDGKGYYNNNNELPSIYDYLLFNNNNQQISDRSLFKSQSAELYEQITSNNVMFCKSSTAEQQQKMIDWIFAPPVWNDGTSIYHLKGYEYGQQNSLMAPYAVKGRAIHDPGEVTLTILAELGWKNVVFDFNPLKDIEKAVAEWPVQVNLNTQDEAFKNVKVVYSFDDFETTNHVYLQRSETFNYFTGRMNLAFHTGQVKYYIEAITADNLYYRHPAVAPSKLFTMNVGPDKFEPQIFHNPVDILAGNIKEPKIHAEASNNVRIKKLRIDYKINGRLQEPVFLASMDKSVSSGSIPLYFLNAATDKHEYELTAEDNSIKDNFTTYPLNSFHEVNIIDIFDPGGYMNQNRKINPWDYVNVEPGKNEGSFWFPLTDKYNAENNINWYTAFTNSLNQEESSAYPHEGMFVNHAVNLTNNTGLEVDDTAIFRFQLASDSSVTGFAWANDNLEIQKSQDNKNRLFAEGSILLYPNPVKNFLSIEWNEQQFETPVDILVTDVQGKIIHRQNDFDSQHSTTTRIDLSSVNPGMYMISINDGNRILSSDKILKN